MSVISNPFVGYDIEEPPESRARIYEGAIVEMLGWTTNSSPAAVNVFGPRGVGKSPILKYLAAGACNQEPFRDALQNFRPEEVCPVLIRPVENLAIFEHFDDELQKALRNNYQLPQEDARQAQLLHDINDELSENEAAYERLIWRLRRVIQNNTRIIFCIDNASDIGLYQDAVITQRLEGLLQFSSLILASRRRISTKVFDGGVGSTLSLKTRALPLGLITREASHRLLSPSSKVGMPQFNDPEKDVLIDYVGRNPYHLIRAAQFAYRHLLNTNSRITESFIITDIAADLRPEYERLWTRHESELREFLKKRREQKLDALQDGRLLTELKSELMIYEAEENKFAFNGKLFEYFINSQISEVPNLSETAHPESHDVNELVVALQIDVSDKPGNLFYILASRPGTVFSDTELMNAIWQDTSKLNALRNAKMRLSKLLAKYEEEHDQIIGSIERDNKHDGYYFKKDSSS